MTPFASVSTSGSTSSQSPVTFLVPGQGTVVFQGLTLSPEQFHGLSQVRGRRSLAGLGFRFGFWISGCKRMFHTACKLSLPMQNAKR